MNAPFQWSASRSSHCGPLILSLWSFWRMPHYKSEGDRLNDAGHKEKSGWIIVLKKNEYPLLSFWIWIYFFLNSISINVYNQSDQREDKLVFGSCPSQHLFASALTVKLKVFIFVKVPKLVNSKLPFLKQSSIVAHILEKLDFS